MRVLFLTQRLPYAPNRGDRVRAYHLLRQLRPHAEIDLLSFVHDDEEASHVAEARDLVSSIAIVRVPHLWNRVRAAALWWSERPATHTMLDGPALRSTIETIVGAHQPDVVFAYCSGVARVALEPPLDRVPLVLDMVDVDSAKWAALAARTGPPRSWIYAREARTLEAFERVIARRAVTTLVTTDKERDTLRGLASEARIEVIQNGVDAESLRPPGPPVDSATVVFCGVMSYQPNEEGALWLVREVWPIVRRRRPDAHLQIVGSNPTGLVRALANADMGVDVTGHVDDVRPYLWNAAVAVAPLLTARGVQNKVLEAVAAGLPAVVTPLVRTGVPPEVQSACLATGGADGFAEAIVQMLETTPMERRARAARADVAALSWERRLAPVADILRVACE